jgi:hypothetical protein
MALLDHPSGPHCIHNLVSRQQLSPPLEQETEQRESAPAQPNRLGHANAVHSEQTAAAAAIEAEPVKPQNVSRTARIHDPFSQCSCDEWP